MGNLCGKEDKGGDNFAGSGRIVGTAPVRPVNAKAKVPAVAVGGPGRTVGSGDDGIVVDAGDPRNAAARAAEVNYNTDHQWWQKLGAYALARSEPGNFKLTAS